MFCFIGQRAPPKSHKTFPTLVSGFFWFSSRDKKTNMRESNKNSSTSSRSKAMESLSLEINRYPRDLLDRFTPQQFVNRDSRAVSDGDDEVEGEVELNLGLSLGGRFGVDKHASKLTRSSSIAGSLPVVRELDDAFGARPVSNYPASLMRTSSLPTETEEEWRKRKEMQSLRRMEAKRRRSEKQKNLRGELNLEEERKDLNLNSRGNWVVPPWPPTNASRGGSQGSVESQGGSSSSLSEMESKPIQGSFTGSESRSPGSFQSLQEQSNPEAIGSSGTKTKEIARTTSRSDMENQPNPSGNRGREIGTNAMEDMPCVFTKGDGPNGRRIDGILYKYGKGEEVRIMCVCHGIFLSPAEFVKHAGGGDVDHPLRHIVINTSGTSFS